MFTRLLHLTIFLALALLPFGTLASPFKRHIQMMRRQEAREDGPFNLTKRYTGTRWSFYNVQTGDQVYCGGYRSNGEAIVALSGANMNTGLCGKSIRMTYNGVTKYATIVDMCPGCPDWGLDLAQDFFPNFAPASVGIIYGDWDFADAAPAAAAPATTSSTPEPQPTTSTYIPPATTSTPAPPPTTTSTPEQAPPTTTSTPEQAPPTTTSTPAQAIPATTTTQDYVPSATQSEPPASSSTEYDCDPDYDSTDYDEPPTSSSAPTASSAPYYAPSFTDTTPSPELSTSTTLVPTSSGTESSSSYEVTSTPLPTETTSSSQSLSSTSTASASATDPAVAAIGSIKGNSASRTFAGAKGISLMIGSILFALHLL